MSSKNLPTCQACRVRHRRCDNRPSACRRCQTNGIDCIRIILHRFRYGPDSKKAPDFSFPTSQPWLLPVESVRFHDETPMLAHYYRGSLFEQAALPGMAIMDDTSLRDCDDSGESLQADQNDIRTPAGPAYEEPLDGIHRHSGSSEGTDWAGESYEMVHIGNPHSTPSISSSSCQRISYSFTASPVVLTPDVEPFSEREAELMRNFIENMALWVDISDMERNFEIEVPRRALANTVLRNAIFAFSARHLNRHKHVGYSSESLDYHNRALQMLIPQISGPEEKLTDDVFAAVVILRLDEEMEEEDTRLHLAGGTRILNSISSFVSSGGLGEAAAWVCLRQDIYISIVSQKPLGTKLDQFHSSDWVRKGNDMCWANRIVLLLASILSHAFAEPALSKQAILQHLTIELKDWHRDKPISFEPIKSLPRESTRNKRLPTIWMLSSYHVLGIQYYHIAKIVLLFALPAANYGAVANIDNFQRIKRVVRTIREHVLIILGLAVSNPRAENTLFTAMHTLTAWGSVLQNPLDQEAATDFLLLMEQRTGWKVSKTLDTLRNKWQEDEESQ